MSHAILFEETLRRSLALDPRVYPAARRLRRFWKSGGPPPAFWTVRWNPKAIDHLRAWAGLDVVRSKANGVMQVDVRRLTEKVGDLPALESELDHFLRSFEKTQTPDDEPARQSLRQGNWSPEARRWLDHILSNTRTLGAPETAEVTAVLKSLELIRSGTGPWHASILGARTGVASKFFRPGMPGRRRLADALLFLKGDSDFSDLAREALLEEAGVLGSDTAYGVLVAGGLTLDGMDFISRLAEKNQAIPLTLQNLVYPRLDPSVEGILTIENEAPFLAAMAEGLHRRWVLVATGGFPNRAVVGLLKSVVPQAASWRHWGDTDLAGIRIARTLADRVGNTPSFFRCTADDVRRWRERLIPLDPGDKKSLALHLRAYPDALGADVLRTVLQEGGWLEQEAWQDFPGSMQNWGST
jgi:hypothetical protein